MQQWVLYPGYILSTKSPTGNDQREAEARFSIIGPIIASIAECTNAVLSIETPGKVVPDYTIYSLNANGELLCAFVECKTRLAFDGNGEFQTIGYNISERESVRIKRSSSPSLPGT